jgi:hypothetical protein
MKKFLKQTTKRDLLVTIKIGEYTIDSGTPIGKIWENPGDILTDGVGIVNILIGLSTVVAVAMIIVSGYTLITSAGNPEKVEQGQKTLTAAIVGLIIVWVVGLIIRLILEHLFKIQMG